MSDPSIALDNPAVTIPAPVPVSVPVPATYGLHSTNSRVSRRSQLSGHATTTGVSIVPAYELDASELADERDDIGWSKNDVGWRRVVRNFSPSWFSVTMGTGIVAVLLATMPFQGIWLHYLSIVFFVLNVILFLAAFVVSFLRYTLYPEIWIVMINDPMNSLFLATAPMGFATLIEMWVLVCVPSWGPWAVTFAWVLWMVDSVAAVAVTIFLCFTLMSHESLDSLSRITAAQLLPIAATIVAAGVGSLVAGVIPNPQHALGTVIACYVMWGMSVPLAMTVIVMYYQRLAVHKLPPREVIVSCFLPLGPLGFGGLAILRLGEITLHLFPVTNTLPAASNLAAPILYVMGFLTALLMWGFGITWLVFALAAIYKSRPFPFGMGWWGFTFPLGVFAASTVKIGEVMPSLVFRILGTIFSCVVILLWIVVAFGTARGAWTGKLFYAPCLANLKRPERLKDAEIGPTKDEPNGHMKSTQPV